jgi:hypothetical protein
MTLIKILTRQKLLESVKPPLFFLRWSEDPDSDLKRGFSGHLQAWYGSEEEAMADYKERLERGSYVPYPPREDPNTGDWNSEPEWGISGYSFKDKNEFDSAMEEIMDIAWFHQEGRDQDLIIFKSSDYILGDGFDGEDVFRGPSTYVYIEPGSSYEDILPELKKL